MIHEISEQEYRALPDLNYSRIKEFNNNPRTYYQKYILKEAIEDEIDSQNSDYIRFGQIIDCLLTCEDEFDYRFQITNAEIPTGQMLSFVQELYKETMIHSVDGKLQESLEVLYDIAYRKVGFKRDTLEKVKERFLTEGRGYYLELREKGERIVISQREYEKATSLVHKLKSHPNSAPMLNKESSDRWTVKNQLILTGTINGFAMKGMLDKVFINEANKIIHPYDLKTTSSGAMFPYNYRKMGYYLQLACYTLLLRENYPEYEVRPLSFLVVDSTMYHVPVLWWSDESHLQQGIKGFRHDGRTYKGLYNILEDLQYSIDNNCFDSTAEIHKNNGRMKLEVFENLD